MADPTPIDQFNTDFGDLQQHLMDYNGLWAEVMGDPTQHKKGVHDLYEDRYNQIVGLMNSPDYHHNPEYILMLFMYLIANQGFEEQDDRLALQGSSLQIEGDLTKVNTDLEQITNTDDKGLSTDYVHATAEGLDKVLNLSKNADETKALNRALGNTAPQFLYNDFKVLRQDIWDGGDTSSPYAPTDPTKPHFATRDVKDIPPSPGDTDPDHGTHYIHYYGSQPGSYNDPTTPPPEDTYLGGLQWAMQQKGFPATRANAAAKNKMDQFNMNTSTTQSTQAATNEWITDVKNQIQAIQAFLTDMMHSMMDTVKSAVQQTSKG